MYPLLNCVEKSCSHHCKLHYNGCSLTALSVGQIAMAEGLPLGVTSSFEEDCCVICKLGFENDKATTVTEKGMMSLSSFSEECGHSELNAYLTTCINKTPIGKVLVHRNYHQDFTNRRRASALEDDQLPQAKRLRFSMLPFNWKKNCMLCGKIAEFDTQQGFWVGLRT